MATDPVLRMLGLARRAGKLAYGDELVREACFDHKTRCVFIAGDAGANAAKKAAFYADKANVPCNAAARQAGTRQRDRQGRLRDVRGSGHRYGGSSRK